VKQVVIVMALLCGCAHNSKAPERATDTFFSRLYALCGKQLAGQVIAGNESDASFKDSELAASFRECSKNELRIAFDVGEDRSRTWIVTRTASGLRLKHRHLLKDGSEDPVSQYGGDTIDPGTPQRQQFPADAYSREMFAREGRQVSIPNVWAFEIDPGGTLIYELSRPGRLFRVRFNLQSPK
jgi:hypothetical protein